MGLSLALLILEKVNVKTVNTLPASSVFAAGWLQGVEMNANLNSHSEDLQPYRVIQSP